MNNKIKIVFLATPDITLKSFEYFINSSDFDVLALVTQPSKGLVRGKVVKHNIVKLAEKYNVPVFEPLKISKDIETIEKLKSLSPDFFVTFAYGQLLSQEVIDIPKFNTINLHASLLPEYRGANPIAQSIIDGKKYTGITTMKTVLAMDAGDICMQEKIDIPESMNVIELMEIISSKSPILLDKTLKGLYEGSLTSTPQDENKVTLTKKLAKEEKLIDWNMDNVKLHNKIRGMYKINTNHTTFNSKLVQIIKTQPVECSNGCCGEIVEISKDGIIVRCKNNALKITIVKPEGKGEIPVQNWVNGARIKVGDKFN